MIIDYAPDRVFTQSIDIVDAGNACLRCIDKDFIEYYIMSKTIMGKSYFLKFGPVIPDLDELQNCYLLSYSYIDYNENKIEREFSMFINDNKKKITTVECIEPEEALQLLPNIAYFWANL